MKKSDLKSTHRDSLVGLAVRGQPREPQTWFDSRFPPWEERSIEPRWPSRKGSASSVVFALRGYVH